MAKSHIKVITYIALAVLAIVLLLIGAWIIRARKYERGYAQVGNGDSKQKIIASMGEPSKVEDCHYFMYSSVDVRDKERCVEMYWYGLFPDEYIFVLDKDGLVIYKFHNVSG